MVKAKTDTMKIKRRVQEWKKLTAYGATHYWQLLLTQIIKLGWAGEHTRWPRRDKGSWVGQKKTLDGRDETKEAGLGRRTH